MANLKKLWVFIPFLAVLLMSHNSFAASGSKNYTSAQGAYGYFIPASTYGRNVSFSGTLPIELITGSTTTNKSLYGVVINYANIPSIITDTDQYHTINWQYTLSASNQNIIWETNETRAPITLTENMGGTTTNFTDKCNYVLSGDNLGVVCSRSYSQGQRPSSVAITLGRTGVFTNSDPSLGLSYYNNVSPFVGATLKVSAVSMTWTSSGTDQSGVIDSVNNVNNTVNNFYNAESGAADNISGQSQPNVGDNSASTNIIGAVGTIFNSILTAPKGNSCSVAANFGNLNLGLLDFCTGKENFTFVVNFVSSISVILIVCGTSLILVKQVLSLYDWARSK